MPIKKGVFTPDPITEKKIVFISGPITGVPDYWEPFEKAEDELTAKGFIALTPSRLPKGMTNAQYMRICFAMIDSADAVLFLPGANSSEGSLLEFSYCNYTKKPFALFGDIQALQEVLK